MHFGSLCEVFPSFANNCTVYSGASWEAEPLGESHVNPPEADLTQLREWRRRLRKAAGRRSDVGARHAQCRHLGREIGRGVRKPENEPGCSPHRQSGASDLGDEGNLRKPRPVSQSPAHTRPGRRSWQTAGKRSSCRASTCLRASGGARGPATRRPCKVGVQSGKPSPLPASLPLDPRCGHCHQEGIEIWVSLAKSQSHHVLWWQSIMPVHV